MNLNTIILALLGKANKQERGEKKFPWKFGQEIWSKDFSVLVCHPNQRIFAIPEQSWNSSWGVLCFGGWWWWCCFFFTIIFSLREEQNLQGLFFKKDFLLFFFDLQHKSLLWREREREKRSRKTLDEAEVVSCILLEFGGELMMILFWKLFWVPDL